MVRRSEFGMSLIEMLAAVFILGFVAAGICGIAATQNLVSFRTNNKMSALIGLRRLCSPASWINCAAGSAEIASLEQQIRMSCFTTFANPPSAPYSSMTIYVPIFTIDGFATRSANGGYNVDTYFYQVVADAANPNTGQFVLQRTLLAQGNHLSPSMPAPNAIPVGQPMTILTGIVGPIDPSNQADPIAGVPPPVVFTQIMQTNSGTLSTPVNGLTGVGISLEVFSNEYSKNASFVPSTVAIHNEIFQRSNLGITF